MEATIDIKLVGSETCSICLTLEKVVLAAVNELGVKATVRKIIDLEEIVNYGVFAIPTVEMNGIIKASGRSPSKKEIMKWLKELM